MSFWKRVHKTLKNDHFLHFGWFICFAVVVLTAGAVHAGSGMLVSFLAIIFGFAVVIRGLIIGKLGSEAGCGGGHEQYFGGWGWAGWMLIVMLFFTSIQLIPMPLPLLGILSPRSAELYQAACERLGDSGCFGTISLAPGNTTYFLWMLLGFFGIYASSTFLFKRYNSTRIGYIALIVAGCAGLLLTIYGMAFGQPVLFGTRGSSSWWMIGPLLNPNHAAAFLGAISLLCLGDSLTRSGGQKAACILLYLIFAVAMVMQLSRGAIAAWVVVHLFMFLINAVRKKSFSLPLAMTILVALGIVTATVCTFSMKTVDEMRSQYAETQIFQIPAETEIVLDNNESHSDFVEKTDLYPDLLRMIGDYPVLGVGRGAFADTFPRYQHFPFNKQFNHAENEYFELLIEYGIFVGLAVLVLGFLFVFSTIRQKKHRKVEKGIELGSITAILFLLIQNALDFNLRYWATAFIFFSLAGMLTARQQWLNKEENEQNNEIDKNSGLKFKNPIYKKRFISMSIGLGVTGLALLMGLVRFSPGIQSFRHGDLLSLETCLRKPGCLRSPQAWIDKSRPVVSAHVASGKVHQIVGYGLATIASHAKSEDILKTAIPWYQASENLSPMAARTYLVEGALHRYLGDTRAAAAALVKSAQLDRRKSLVAMRMLAELKGEWDIHQNIPNTPEDATILGHFLLTKHDYQNTLIIAEHLIQTRPKLIEGYSLTLECYRKMQILPAASDTIELMKKNLPYDIQSFVLEVDFLVETGQVDEAFDRLKDGRDVFGNEALYWYANTRICVFYGARRGMDWYRQNTRESLQNFSSYIFTSDKIRSQYYWLSGEFYFKMNELKKAKNYFERSSERKARERLRNYPTQTPEKIKF